MKKYQLHKCIISFHRLFSITALERSPHADLGSARGTGSTHRVGERLYRVLISQICFERFSFDSPMSSNPENERTAIAVGEFPDLSSSDAEQIRCFFDREQLLVFQIRQICFRCFLLLLFLLFFHHLHQVESTHILLHDRCLILFNNVGYLAFAQLVWVANASFLRFFSS